jgi:hypothetical protein
MKDLIQHNSVNNNTMNKINRVHIATKLKDENKNHLDSKNYRFIQIHSKAIKLIDRLWCFKVHKIVKELNTNIFKSNLLKEMNKNVVHIATENTLSRDNVVLIDIEKAFDSCDYNVVEELLIRNLTRKSNEQLATILTKQYIYIIRQRVIYYKDNIITFVYSKNWTLKQFLEEFNNLLITLERESLDLAGWIFHGQINGLSFCSDFTVNPKIEKYLTLRAFKEYGASAIPMHLAIFSIPLRIAMQMSIPLII